MFGSACVVLRRAVTAAFLGCFAAGAASAHEACGQFVLTPTGSRINLFSEFTPTFRSGDGVQLIGVFSVALRPREEVVFPVKSENARGGVYGGIFTIENVPAGRYRIALSGDARMEAVQLFRGLPLTEIPRDPDCPGEVRRVEVSADDGPLTIQVDDAGASSVLIAVYRP